MYIYATQTPNVRFTLIRRANRMQMRNKRRERDFVLCVFVCLVYGLTDSASQRPPSDRVGCFRVIRMRSSCCGDVYAFARCAERDQRSLSPHISRNK